MKDETMNLGEIKDLLGDVSNTDAFDLDSIIAEVSGKPSPVPSAPKREQTPPRPAEPQRDEVRQPAREREPAPRHIKAEEPAGAQKEQPKPERAHERPAERQREQAPAKWEQARGDVAAPVREETPARESALRRDSARARTELPKREEETARRTAPKRREKSEPPAEQTLPDITAFEEQQDPRAMRRAKREQQEARAAQKREKKASRGRASAQQEQPADGAPRAVRARKGDDGRKLSRKEELAARRAAEQAEELQDIEVRDPTQAVRTFTRRARGLGVRSILVLILGALAVYLSIAPQIEALSVPVLLDVTENAVIGIGALMLLQFLSLFLAVDVFGMGFLNLFSGAPDRSTLVSITVLATLLHGASIIVFENDIGVDIPYFAVSILMLYALMREERGRFAARMRAYKAISSAEQPMAVYSHYDPIDDVCRAVKGPLPNIDAFLREMERPDSVDRFSMIYTPVALAACVVFSLIASVGRGEPMRFFWAFSALLCVSAPIGLLCAFGASYKNISRRLLGSGAAMAGARQANFLRGTEEVVLTENELFPEGAIALEALQNMGVLSDDKILGVAAAMTSGAGLRLGTVLTDTMRERYGTTMSVKNVQSVEGGLTAEVGTNRLVLGTAALMVKMGIRMRAGQQADKVIAYLVVDNTLAGALTLRYQPTKHTYQAMRSMRRMHMCAALAVHDFNISPAMVEAQFDMRRGFADQPGPDTVARLLDDGYAQGDAPAAILTREGAGPFMQVLRSADKLAGAVRSCITLGAFAGVAGMLIVFYLVFQNAANALPVTNLLLYLLIWFVPVFLITQQTH